MLSHVHFPMHRWTLGFEAFAAHIRQRQGYTQEFASRITHTYPKDEAALNLSFEMADRVVRGKGAEGEAGPMVRTPYVRLRSMLQKGEGQKEIWDKVEASRSKAAAGTPATPQSGASSPSARTSPTKSSRAIAGGWLCTGILQLFIQNVAFSHTQCVVGIQWL